MWAYDFQPSSINYKKPQIVKVCLLKKFQSLILHTSLIRLCSWSKAFTSADIFKLKIILKIIFFLFLVSKMSHSCIWNKQSICYQFITRRKVNLIDFFNGSLCFLRSILILCRIKRCISSFQLFNRRIVRPRSWRIRFSKICGFFRIRLIGILI